MSPAALVAIAAALAALLELASASWCAASRPFSSAFSRPMVARSKILSAYWLRQRSLSRGKAAAS
jgi:hypothetical protein